MRRVAEEEIRMSAVTAGIIVGSRHRSDPGVQPRWLVVLHEGRSYAWHLLKLHLSGKVVTDDPDDPPGVLWKASADEDLIGDLSLLLHLHAARTPEVVNATRKCLGLRGHRVDLAALEGAELGAVEHAREIATRRGRELMLATTILPGSRLTEEALLAMPDWEMSISHTAVVREWNAMESALVTTDYRTLPEPEFDDESGWDDELSAETDAAPQDYPGLDHDPSGYDSTGHGSASDAAGRGGFGRDAGRSAAIEPRHHEPLHDEPLHHEHGERPRAEDAPRERPAPRRFGLRREKKVTESGAPGLGLADLFGPRD